MPIRLYVELPLVAGSEVALPAAAARHAQVRRVQPGELLTLFDGQGHDWPAEILVMGRSEVRVRIGAPMPVHNELPQHVTLAVGMPANERMDTLVEKATELGVAAIQPLTTERSVLRLAGERAQRKQAHWQAIAQAASEQSGRARVPRVLPVLPLPEWLAAAPPGQRFMMSLRVEGRAPADLVPADGPVVSLSGPEGGLSPAEEEAALRHGFVPVCLGPRVLRADTAPLALLAWFSLRVPTRKSG